MGKKKTPANQMKEYEKAKQELELLQQQIELERQEQELKDGLPFLHKYKHYTWSRDFYESAKHWNFLCAANQIGKSTVNIRRCINLATNKELWPKLWPGRTPNLFWYFYPSNKQVETELQTKWDLYLPQGRFKDSGPYAWKYLKDAGAITGIEFLESGIRLEFKFYSQKESHLQSSSVYAVFLDEECPVNLLSEIQLRISNTEGYFHMVFTATLGQDYWRRTIEPRPDEEELYVEDSLKLQVSMYDCMQFEDGTTGQWSAEKIKRVEASCNSQTQVLMRVYGRFIKEEGNLYSSFVQEKNTLARISVPPSWRYYVSVDIGSGKSLKRGSHHGAGGEGGFRKKTNHLASIVILAVNPEYNKGVVVDCWRGDGITTTATDILLQMQKMEKRTILDPAQLNMRVYDAAAIEFGNIAATAGISLVSASKKINSGVATVNNLFALTMLYVAYMAEDSAKMVTELMTVTEKTAGWTPNIDDLSDALRYAAMAVPWNWDLEKLKELLGVNVQEEADKAIIKVAEKTPAQIRSEERMNYRVADQLAGKIARSEYDSEIEEFNELYGN